ncbi:hypothetical protein GN956_G5907 [Arapaima gigas]
MGVIARISKKLTESHREHRVKPHFPSRWNRAKISILPFLCSELRAGCQVGQFQSSFYLGCSCSASRTMSMM